MKTPIISKVRVARSFDDSRVEGELVTKDRVKAERGHSSASVHESVCTDKIETTLLQLNNEFDELFSLIRKANKAPKRWAELTNPDSTGPHFEMNQLWRKLIVRIQYHLLGIQGTGAPTVHAATLLEISKQTRIDALEFQELAYIDIGPKVLGTWMPISARMTQLETKVVATADPILEKFENISKKLTPPMGSCKVLPPALGREKIADAKKDGNRKEAARLAVREALTWPVKLYYEIMDVLLPVMDAAGKPTQAAIEKAAAHLEKMGDEKRNEAQRMFREMNKGLANLQSSPKRLEKISAGEQKYTLLSAALLRGAAEDLDSWFDLLRDPSKRQDHELIGKLKKNTNWDGIAQFLNGLGGFVGKITDQKAWELFCLRIAPGVGAGIAGQGIKLAAAINHSSLKEYRNGVAAVRLESLWEVITWVARLKSTSRGASLGFPAWGPAFVKAGKYYKTVNLKNELGFPVGFSFHTDAQLPPGLEISLYFALGLPGIFDLRVGADITVYHPHLAGFRHFVNPAGNALGAASEWLVNLGQATALAARLEILRASTAHPETKGLPKRSVEEVLPERLRSSAAVLHDAQIALGTVRVFQRQLKEEGAAIFDPKSHLYHDLVNVIGAERSLEFVGDMLVDKEKELVAGIDRVKELLMQPYEDHWKDLKLRAKIARACSALRPLVRFLRTDILLCQVFDSAAVGESIEAIQLAEAEAIATAVLDAAA